MYFNDKSPIEKRKFLFLVFSLIIVLIGILYFSYYLLLSSNHIETDDAYVAADIVQITPSTSGTVKQVFVTDTDHVKKGDILVIIDDVDARLALARAKAHLAKTQSELERTKQRHDHRKSLASSGAISGENLMNTTQSYQAAQAIYEAAKISVDQALIDFKRTTIRSPIDGVIAKRQIDQGQHIQLGYPMMSVVPLQNIYVNANYKEGQLLKLKIGQPVKLTSDVYGQSVIYHGKLAGISAGTGSAFAIIPAQNATGNWIKVVQRLPVRVALDATELKQHPLQVGLSMHTDVDVSPRKAIV